MSQVTKTRKANQARKRARDLRRERAWAALRRHRTGPLKRPLLAYMLGVMAAAARRKARKGP